MKWISALWFNQTIRAAAAIMAASFLGAALASAQTEVPLFTYPITTSNTTGIVWPGLVTQGADGELYSTIQSNGANHAGTVYKITTNGIYTQVYSFCAEGGHCLLTGTAPDGGVTLGTDGNYYGTTQNGGTYGAGTIFKVTPPER